MIPLDFNNPNDREQYRRIVEVLYNRYGSEFINDCLRQIKKEKRYEQEKIIKAVIENHEKMNTLKEYNRELLNQKYVNSEAYREIVKTHLYAFGIDNLLIIQDKFLEQEQYEKCAVIRDVIKHHNRIAKDKLLTVRKEFV